MKNTAFAVFFLAFLASSVSAQFVSPVPVVESEVRDGTSIKMRSMELDRVKREAGKNPVEKLGPAAINNFLEIKEDFEKIQVLENNIVKVYTTGKQIDFAKIAAFSDKLNESAVRLKKNLFSSLDKDPKKTPNDSPEAAKKSVSGGVKNLIVELDRAIGAFVNNPIFQTSKKSGLKEKERAAIDLERVATISVALRQESEKQVRPEK